MIKNENIEKMKRSIGDKVESRIWENRKTKAEVLRQTGLMKPILHRVINAGGYTIDSLARICDALECDIVIVTRK